MSEAPLAVFRRLCSHPDYFGAMDTEVSFEVEASFHGNKEFDFEVVTADFHTYDAGWVIEKGTEKIIVPREETEDVNAAKFEATGTKGDIIEAEMEMGVTRDV